MEYNDTLKKIHSFERLGMKLGLDRMQKLLGLMGNPEKKLKFIHVAGTNGKGSVCTMLASVMEQGGYKTGLYTSPAVIDFRERIKVNGQMIKKGDHFILPNGYGKVDLQGKMTLIASTIA